MKTFLSVLFCCVGGAASAETIIVTNVHGYSLTPDHVVPFVAMTMVDGKVDQLYDAFAAIPRIPGETVIDGKGQTLLPGLTDAHGHVLELGQQRLQVDLRGTATVGAALDRVKKFAADQKSGWVLGRGWNQVLWPDKQFPTAAQLDSVVADRPVLLSRVDGHAIWVNSAALRLTGVTKATPDPSGGQILRDSAGNPSGVFVDAARSLIERKMPPTTDDDIKRALLAAFDELSKLGLTGVHDAGVDMRTYRQYEALGKEGKLSLRVYAMLADRADARQVIASGPRPSEFDDRLQLRSVKAWVDGALGSRGAALLEDYSDRAGYRGTMLYSAVQMQELAKLCASNGWQLNVHAIGDAGNRVALDAFEIGYSAAQRLELRPRIEHAQIVSLQDIPRFAKLGVIASMQPTHATSDMNMAEDRVGPKRIQGGYAWRKLKNSGAHLAGGSDFPVELPNPFYGLYAAVTRMSRDGKPPGGWYPEEKLSREEALRLFTSDAAYAARMEKQVGSLQPGQWADFILVDRDYFKVPESDIDDTVVVATYVAGKQVAGK